MNSSYPIQDYGPLMKGMMIGGLGIFHVFLAQMAIGGGMLLCYFEWLRRTGKSRGAGRFISGYFQGLVLLSFVLGALTGVAMWFISIQVSPRTIGVLVDEFHWIWATEWTFFCVEVVSGYAFLRYRDRLSAQGRMTLLAFYSAAAWLSLFWINGILSFQLTPGRWLETHGVFAGLFNPSFWPSLLYRTVAAMAIAALAACVVIDLTGPPDRETRRELIGHASVFLAPMVLMPVLGLWYLSSMPSSSRSWVLGGSVTLTMFMGMGVGASLLIGLYAMGAFWLRRLYINGFTAALLCALALAATAGGEFVREGVRKPYSIHQVLYSNSLRPDELAQTRVVGAVAGDPYPLRDGLRYPTAQLETGAKVYRALCSVCHTYSGANGILELTATWTDEQKRLNIAQLQRTKPFMPPFAGTPLELEALVQLLGWRSAGMPKSWPVSDDPVTLERIKTWLDQAGTAPGIELPVIRGAMEMGAHRGARFEPAAVAPHGGRLDTGARGTAWTDGPLAMELR
jgi:cytochrome bd-type quinol oxidase subunit 1